jgi:hypothetical protein
MIYDDIGARQTSDKMLTLLVIFLPLRLSHLQRFGMIRENNAAAKWHEYPISFLLPWLLPFLLLLHLEINILASQFNVFDNRTGDQSMLIGKLLASDYSESPLLISLS